MEPNDDLRKIFSLNLTTFAGTDVIHRMTSEDVIALLRILPQVSLIITHAQMNGEETAVRIHNFIESEGLETSLIVIGECPTLATEVLCLQAPVSWEILIKHAAKYLGVTMKETSHKVKPDYIPVNILYFYDINHTPCDIYIRIKKGPGDYQYVKRIHSKDQFDRVAINKYEEQGLKELYIAKDYIQYFTTFVTNNLVQKLERTDLSLEQRILTTANGHEIVRETIQSVGLEDSIIELSDAAIASMVKTVKDSPQTSSLLKFLFTNKIAHAYQQCHLLALMCHYILLKQTWYKEGHLEILSFASFFSDLTLKSSQQMQISSLAELNDSTLNDEERKAVLTHARDSVTQIKNHPELNELISTVMLQSHGKEDGIGFDDHPGENIHQLSKVFIISDCFVKILLNPTLPSTKKEILPLLYERFEHPSYQKIIKALEAKFE
jgi:HD-GYP domain-containing protein (c-di-GMP phosphodiesterase class II)